MYEHVHFIVLNVFSFIVKSAVNQNASYQLLYDLIHRHQVSYGVCIICLFLSLS